VEFSAAPALKLRVLKQNRLDRFVELSWLALVVAAANGGCGARIEPGDAGATRDDAGPVLRGHVGGGVGGDGGNSAPDAGADSKVSIDGSPVIDATVPIDTRANDVPLAPVDSGPPDLGHPDLGRPDLGPPDLGPPDLGPPDLGPPDLGPPDLGSPDVPPPVCVPGSNRCVAGNVQICDATGAWQTTGTATQELLVNPAFDLAPLETGWTNPGSPIVYQALAPGAGVTNHPDVAAQSLPNLAWFGGLDSADDRLSQSIAIPAGASQLTFSLFYAVVTGKTGVTELDTFDATLLAGTQVISVAHLSNLNATDTWTPVSVPLPAALAGQTVTLQLRGVTNTNVNRFTSFYLDTMSLQAVACP